jgi:hypothetical protein
MFGRKTLIAAGLVYLAVLGCIVWPGADGAPSGAAAAGRADSPNRLAQMTGLPLRGVALRIDGDDIAPFVKRIDDIAAMGADTVCLVVEAHQEDAESEKNYVDVRRTPDPPKLLELITHAKSKNLKVIVATVLVLDEPKSDETTADLRPTGPAATNSWHTWFDDWREVTMHFARVAHAGKADAMIIGSGMTSSESKPAEWITTIEKTRMIYLGPVGYAAPADRAKSLLFADHLDFIAVEDLPGTADKSRERALDGAREQHRPIVAMQAGWASRAPSTASGDPAAFAAHWSGHPEVMGWLLTDQPAADAAVKELTTKPKWDVKP